VCVCVCVCVCSYRQQGNGDTQALVPHCNTPTKWASHDKQCVTSPQCDMFPCSNSTSPLLYIMQRL